MKKIKKYLLAASLFAFSLLPTVGQADRLFSRAVVFGDSLSDPGNAYFLRGRHLKPPYDTLDAFLIPDAPYARGGNHFSNGKTWIEQLASRLDLGKSAGPAFSGVNRENFKKSNYAVGGARAYDDGLNVNLTDQVSAFFADAGGIASADALYVVALGGNDVRDAIGALSIDSTGRLSSQIITHSLSAFSDNIIALYGAGARSFLIANSPDLSVTPGIKRLDNFSPGVGMAAAILSAQFNTAFDSVLDQLTASLPNLQIARIDLMQTLQEIINNPKASRLTNVTDACVRPNQKPATCKHPRRYLFWDGIHPTKAAHTIVARRAMTALRQILPTRSCKGRARQSETRRIKMEREPCPSNSLDH